MRLDIGDGLLWIGRVAGGLAVVVHIGAGDGRSGAVDEAVVPQIPGQPTLIRSWLSRSALRCSAGLPLTGSPLGSVY